MRLSFTALLLGSFTALSAQSAMTLDQAIAFATENNQQVKMARLEVEDAAAQIIERRAFGIPQLNGDVGYNRFLALPVTILPEEFGLDPSTGEPNPNFSREVRFGVRHNITGTLTLKTMVFDPSYFVGLKAARAYRDYTAQELVSTQRTVRYQVIDAFLPVLVLRENLANLDQNINNLEKVRSETQRLYEEGFAELLDVERLDLSLFSLRTERDQWAARETEVLNGLKMVIGWPMDKPLDITGDLSGFLVAMSDQDLSDSLNYQAWPDYRVAQQGYQLARLNERLNRYAYYPSMDAFANVQQMYMGDRFDDGVWATSSVAGLGLKIPLFDGMLTHAKVQRATITRQNTEIQISLLEQRIDMEVRNARSAYTTSLDRLRNQERHLALAEKIYQTTRVKYREGIGSSLETHQAEQALFAAQRQHIQARYEVVQAIYRLKQALGH